MEVVDKMECLPVAVEDLLELVRDTSSVDLPALEFSEKAVLEGSVVVEDSMVSAAKYGQETRLQATHTGETAVGLGS